MGTRYAFENLLRDPFEFLVSGVSFGFSLICVMDYPLLGLSRGFAFITSSPFIVLGIIRFFQGMNVMRYRKRLLTLTPFSFGTEDVPLSKTHLYLGKGFQWQPIHRQRMHLFSLVENQRFLQKSALYRCVQRQAIDKPLGFSATLTKRRPFLPQPDIGGKPWLHGVGSQDEQTVFMKQMNRKNHTLVLGMTGVGKTRLMSILANQDIRNGEAVLVIDPKGDLSIIQDMYAACRSAKRLSDFKVCHAGFSDVSAKYNPLLNYSDVSEIATRVTSAMDASGDGKQFQDFAWKFLNITATCLEEMNETISYKSLAFFVIRPRQLLLAYCDKVLPLKDPHYLHAIDEIIQASVRVDKNGKALEPMSRGDAAQLYISDYIEKVMSGGDYQALHDSIIADLHHAAGMSEEYYGKITASLGPVFDKINKTAAGEVFSWDSNIGLPEINLEEMIKRKEVIYIGLDALSNRAMSEAVGKAVIADLISLCGRLYKDIPEDDRTLCLHADEFSEVISDAFITLLNKAGSAGVRVTAYMQTVNDLGVAFGSDPNKPKMLLGNFGSMITLRIANQDTAKVLTECLETIRTRSSTPSTMSNDHSDGEGGELFTTYNTDVVNEDKAQFLTENDLFSLPKGQAFVLTNGGELFKIRIPLPKNDGQVPPTFEMLMSEVNLCFA